MRLIDADALREKHNIDLDEQIAPTIECEKCEKMRADIKEAVRELTGGKDENI